MSIRQERVEELLRHELAAILQNEMRDPRVRLATVSHLKVTRDLSHAEVGVSVLGDDADREACVAVLQRAKGFVRSALARRVHLRSIPELHFRLDRGAEHSERIREILEGLNDEETP